MPTAALLESDPSALPPIQPPERVQPTPSSSRDRHDRGRKRGERSRSPAREPGAPSGKRRDQGKGEHVDIHV